MHVALFSKSIVDLGESVVEFVQHPLDMSWIFDSTNTLLLGSVENIFLSESCLNGRLGWSDHGEEYTCQTKVIQFSKSSASSQDDFFAIQDIILLFCGKKRKSIL